MGERKSMWTKRTVHYCSLLYAYHMFTSRADRLHLLTAITTGFIFGINMLLYIFIQYLADLMAQAFYSFMAGFIKLALKQLLVRH